MLLGLARYDLKDTEKILTLNNCGTVKKSSLLENIRQLQKNKNKSYILDIIMEKLNSAQKQNSTRPQDTSTRPSLNLPERKRDRFFKMFQSESKKPSTSSETELQSKP